jgi:hypothetical protein
MTTETGERSRNQIRPFIFDKNMTLVKDAHFFIYPLQQQLLSPHSSAGSVVPISGT